MSNDENKMKPDTVKVTDLGDHVIRTEVYYRVDDVDAFRRRIYWHRAYKYMVLISALVVSLALSVTLCRVNTVVHSATRVLNNLHGFTVIPAGTSSGVVHMARDLVPTDVPMINANSSVIDSLTNLTSTVATQTSSYSTGMNMTIAGTMPAETSSFMGTTSNVSMTVDSSASATSCDYSSSSDLTFQTAKPLQVSSSATSSEKTYTSTTTSTRRVTGTVTVTAGSSESSASSEAMSTGTSSAIALSNESSSIETPVESTQPTLLTVTRPVSTLTITLANPTSSAVGDCGALSPTTVTVTLNEATISTLTSTLRYTTLTSTRSGTKTVVVSTTSAHPSTMETSGVGGIGVTVASSVYESLASHHPFYPNSTWSMATPSSSMSASSLVVVNWTLTVDLPSMVTSTGGSNGGGGGSGGNSPISISEGNKKPEPRGGGRGGGGYCIVMLVAMAAVLL